jgi:hypothetical protein
MYAPWVEALRHVCKRACVEAGSPRKAEVVLFYLARWCQKKTKQQEPDPARIEGAELHQGAARIVRNLAEAGERVDRLVAGDAAELSELERLLLASARPRAQEAAPEYAEEALQKICIVLLTGTPPSRAIEALRDGPRGPANEYVFQSPFEFWARSVVIRLFIDAYRGADRERRGPPPPTSTKGAPPLDSGFLKAAHDELPALVEAIGGLPPAQRSVMTLSLCSPDIDELVREHLHELDPDLFTACGGRLFASDSEIADHLGTTRQSVTSNRSLGRRALAERDDRWEALLDHLLPHKSTRPIHESQ